MGARAGSGRAALVAVLVALASLAGATACGVKALPRPPVQPNPAGAATGLGPPPQPSSEAPSSAADRCPSCDAQGSAPAGSPAPEK
jgi:hypothetical protein